MWDNREEEEEGGGRRWNMTPADAVGNAMSDRQDKAGCCDTAVSEQLISLSLVFSVVSLSCCRTIRKRKDIGMEESSRPKQKNEWNEAFVYDEISQRRVPPAHL